MASNYTINTSYNPIDNNNRYNFHTIPIAKFVLMSWVTFGLWTLRWCYKTWQNVAIDYDYKISPFWRSAFLGIFNFSLFKIVEKHANHHGENFVISSTWLAILFLFVCLLPTIDNIIVELILFFLFLLPFAYVQHKINKVNEKVYPDAFVEKWNIIDTITTIIGIGLRIFSKIVSKRIFKD